MDKPIGMVHLVDCLYVGGTEWQMVELLRRIDRRRFRPLVACFKLGGELLPTLRQMDIEPRVFPLRGSLTRANTAWQVARLAWWCRREGVQLLQSYDFYSNVVGMAAARLAGIRAVAGRRDLAHWLSPVQTRTLRLALSLADCVIANAGAVASQVQTQQGVSRDKIRIVPNGIDLERFDARRRTPPTPPLPPLPPFAHRVGMVASMHLPDKGHTDLLEAALLLKRRGHVAQYLLVSDGALRPSLEAKSRAMGLNEEVHFLGRRSDVPSVLQALEVLVHPSWAEGFPNAILEAMSAERPVVATSVGGIPEVMRHRETGLLVPPRTPAALADALEHIWRDPPLARQMGQAGRRRVETVYALDRMHESISAIYDALLARRSLPELGA